MSKKKLRKDIVFRLLFWRDEKIFVKWILFRRKDNLKKASFYGYLFGKAKSQLSPDSHSLYNSALAPNADRWKTGDGDKFYFYNWLFIKQRSMSERYCPYEDNIRAKRYLLILPIKQHEKNIFLLGVQISSSVFLCSKIIFKKMNEQIN